VLFSLETLIITVSAGAVAALVVGFVTGYCCGRRCQKDAEIGTLGHLGYPGRYFYRPKTRLLKSDDRALN